MAKESFSRDVYSSLSWKLRAGVCVCGGRLETGTVHVTI